MTLNRAMRVSAMGMSAERTRMDVTSQNIANANSSGINGADPYRRKMVMLQGDENGVHVTQIVEDLQPFLEKYEPWNPNADVNGNVKYANIKPIEEMVNMMSASRAYEANIAAFNSTKAMIRSALSIGKV